MPDGDKWLALTHCPFSFFAEGGSSTCCPGGWTNPEPIYTWWWRKLKPNYGCLASSVTVFTSWSYSEVCKVSSECFQNHFISEKYATLQLFKLYFLQISPLVQLYTSDSNCKGAGNIPRSHFFEKPFQLLCHILHDVSIITKTSCLQCWFHSRWQVKISWRWLRRVWEMLQCFHVLNRSDCCARVLSWRRKKKCWFPLFGAFPCDHIPKVKKDVNMHFFIHGSNFCTLYQGIPATFWSYYIYPVVSLFFAYHTVPSFYTLAVFLKKWM